MRPSSDTRPRADKPPKNVRKTKATSRDIMVGRRRQTPEDAKGFHMIFSHSGALWVANVASKAITAAKAKLAALGISPEDPSSKDEDPRFKLS